MAAAHSNAHTQRPHNAHYAQQPRIMHASRTHRAHAHAATECELFLRVTVSLRRPQTKARHAQKSLNRGQRGPTPSRGHLHHRAFLRATQHTHMPTTRPHDRHSIAAQNNRQQVQSQHTIALLYCCRSAFNHTSQPCILGDRGIVGIRYHQV